MEVRLPPSAPVATGRSPVGAQGPLADGQHADDIVYPATIPFILAHLVCFAAIWTGVSASALWLCLALYLIRMFGVTAGYHRYFSHRSYRTSRVGQFLLAFLAQTSAQRGVLWWAAMHRAHHKYSDTPLDVHSPRHRGFWYSHFGWIFGREDGKADESLVADLAKYPELVWLDRHRYLPAILLGIAVWLVGGWTWLVVGFFWSTALLYHGTFMINSLAHVHGSQRYVTGDDSRNHWLLALVALGEGWHNNHHHYPTSTRQGFRWWEFDITFYTLRTLALFRVVRDLRSPPADIVRAERALGPGVLERVAHQLAETVHLEPIAERLRERWRERLAALQSSSEEARRRLAALPEAVVELCRKELPSFDELRARARGMFAETPHLDAIVERGRQLLVDRLSRHLLESQAALA